MLKVKNSEKTFAFNVDIFKMSTQIKNILDILPKSLYDTSDMENLNILRVIHANISDHL